MTDYQEELNALEMLVEARDFQGIRELSDTIKDRNFASTERFRNLYFRAARVDDCDIFIILSRFPVQSFDYTFTGFDRLFQSGSPRCVTLFMLIHGRCFYIDRNCPFGFREDLTEVYSKFMTPTSGSRHSSWPAEMPRIYPYERRDVQQCSSESLLLCFKHDNSSVSSELSTRGLDFVTIPFLARLVILGKFEGIRYLIGRGYDINQRDEQYGTILHLMAALVDSDARKTDNFKKFCSEFREDIQILPDSEGLFPGLRRGTSSEVFSFIIENVVLPHSESLDVSFYSEHSDIYHFLGAVFATQLDIWNTQIPPAFQEQCLPYLLQTKDGKEVKELLSSNWIDDLTDETCEHVIFAFVAVGQDFSEKFVREETKNDWISSCQSPLTQRFVLEVFARSGHSELCISLIDSGFQHDIPLTQRGTLFSVALDIHDPKLIERTGSLELKGVELFCYKQILENKNLRTTLSQVQDQLTQVQDQLTQVMDQAQTKASI